MPSCNVHTAGKVDEKLIKQIERAKARDIKLTLNIGEDIRFTPDEVEIIGKSMVNYLERLETGLNKTIEEHIASDFFR